jgi:eukaryotic-like serine/threonine-protein kinase
MAKPAVGRIVARRYALKTPLGQGGMGMVWRAYDVVLGREVVVKEIAFSPTLPDGERRSIQARVLREARAAARLNHPGLVTVYDAIQDRGSTLIVMELVRAPTLAELVQAEGPLPPERVAEIGAQVASALMAAHRAGIVHGIVTPGNVMVPEGRTARLADFGIASLLGDPRLTSTGLVVGSPAYTAPEQAKGEPSGPATDFWGLGATMYYAVEGEAPFDRGSPTATLAAVVNEEPRPMRRAGPLAPLLSSLLTKNPAARPPATALWVVNRLLSATPPASRPEPAGRHAPLPAGPPQQPEEGLALEPARAPAWKHPAGPAPLSGPSRPTIPPVPAVRRRGGGLLLSLLALLLVGGLLVAWLANGLTAGSGEDRAAPATTQDGAGATTMTERVVPTTKEPEVTQAPTTATGAPPHEGLPGGWRAFTNKVGNSRVGIPPGFDVRTRSRYNATVVQERRDPGRVLTVRSTNPANPLPQASRSYRAWAQRNMNAFRELRYAENQTYAGHDGAVVFEYEAVRNGRRVHVSHVNVKGRTWGYNVEFITPAEQWENSKGLVRQFEQAFKPLG